MDTSFIDDGTVRRLHDELRAIDLFWESVDPEVAENALPIMIGWAALHEESFHLTVQPLDGQAVTLEFIAPSERDSVFTIRSEGLLQAGETQLDIAAATLRLLDIQQRDAH
jgi:hypothetical protein